MSHVWMVEAKVGRVWTIVHWEFLHNRVDARTAAAWYHSQYPSGSYRVRRYQRVEP